MKTFFLLFYAAVATFAVYILATRHSADALVALAFCVFWLVRVYRTPVIEPYTREVVLQITGAVLVGLLMCFAFLSALNASLW